MTDTSAAPARQTFAGWVPTITGQLSFSLIGAGTNSDYCVTANVETREALARRLPTRHVLVYQERVARDLPIYGWLAKRIRPWVRTHYVLVASSERAARPRLDLPQNDNGRYRVLQDEIGVLKGKVYMIAHDQGKAARIDDFIRSVTGKISAIEKSTPRGTLCGGVNLATAANIVPDAADAAAVLYSECEFELYRSGEVRLHFDPSARIFEEAIDAEGENPTARDDVISALSKQAYYFIKDISHRHFHHHSSSDNMLPAFRSYDGDDDSWRRDSLWSLSRAVLEHRRRNALVHHKRALGILAYAESFQAHLACVRRAADGGFEPSEAGMSFDFSHTRESLVSTIDEMAFEKSFWPGVFGIVVATVLATMALWIGAVQIAESLCQPDSICIKARPPEALASVLRWAIEQPVYVFAIVLALMVVWGWHIRRGMVSSSWPRAWMAVLGEWSMAAGASVSRWMRKKHPTWGDRLGMLSAFGIAFLSIIAALFAIGGVFSLHALWPTVLTLEAWIG